MELNSVILKPDVLLEFNYICGKRSSWIIYFRIFRLRWTVILVWLCQDQIWLWQVLWAGLMKCINQFVRCSRNCSFLGSSAIIFATAEYWMVSKNEVSAWSSSDIWHTTTFCRICYKIICRYKSNDIRGTPNVELRSYRVLQDLHSKPAA